MDDYLALNNIIYRVAELPRYIKGLTVKKNEYYIILINDKLDNQTQEKTFLHELAHIGLGHLELDDIAEHYALLEQEVYDVLGY
jgi:Domain of unknown function (DUF955).